MYRDCAEGTEELKRMESKGLLGKENAMRDGVVKGLGAKGIQIIEEADVVEIVLPDRKHFRVNAQYVRSDSVGLFLDDDAPVTFFREEYAGKIAGPEVVVPPAVLKRLQ